MRIDLPNLVGATIVTGSLAITGSVTPGSDALYDFGSALRRWNNIYAANLSGSLTGSGLTAGSVVYVGTGGVLTQNNSNLFWDNSNTRLGVGTASPGYKLTIAGGPPGGQAVFAVDNTAYFVAKNSAGTYEDYFWPRWSDNIMYLNYGSAGWNIRNNSSTSTMFMTNGGNVGIGTTNPQQRLQIGSLTSTSTASPDVLSLGGTFSSTAGSNIKLRVWTDGSTMFGLGASTGQLDYSVTTGASHVWYIAGTEYLRLNSSVLGVSSSLQPGTDNTYSLGASSKRWSTVFANALSGSLTKLASGADYLVGGSGITLSTGSNGSVTINLGAVSYTTASFTNATTVTVNHSVGTTLYDIEVFDTGYSKIIPMTATATSNTQSVVTFAIPTSGYVAVGGPMAGAAASILTATTGSAPYYGARAWVKFNGTGTVAIGSSANVTSITDNGTGDYTVNFTTAMEDANYSIVGMSQYVDNGGQTILEGPNSPTASAARVRTKSNTNTSFDAVHISVAVFR